MTIKANQIIGNFAETKKARELQQGKFPMPREFDKWTRLMINKTQLIKDIPSIAYQLSKQEIKRVWRITKEMKASSPSGRYNAVYKAMCYDEELTDLLVYTMNLPLIIGKPYKRWSTMLDIMTFKKK